MGFRVGMTYNIKSEFPIKPGDPPDINAELDSEETVKNIEQGLREGGHEVVRIGGARSLLQRSTPVDVDIVFNIAEGYEGRNRESQVPILLEMLRVPFVGADGLTLGLTLDKVLTKKVLIAEGIPTPRFTEVTSTENLGKLDLRYPLIVKLRCEGSSKGLSEKSLVNTPLELRRQVEWLMQTYPDFPIFIEEFIEGEEFTVALIGNESPTIFPPVQISLDGITDLGRKFYTFAYLRSGANYVFPAPISNSLARRMQELALATYKSVECRDFGRVDFRVDRQGNPYALEINPLPSLSVEDVFAIMAKTYGWTYASMINRILEAGLVRCGLLSREEAPVLSARPLR
jgi:D-alanine-D-alanine ligase